MNPTSIYATHNFQQFQLHLTLIHTGRNSYVEFGLIFPKALLFYSSRPLIGGLTRKTNP